MSQSICSLFLFLRFPDNSWETSLRYVQPAVPQWTQIHHHADPFKWETVKSKGGQFSSSSDVPEGMLAQPGQTSEVSQQDFWCKLVWRHRKIEQNTLLEWKPVDLHLRQQQACGSSEKRRAETGLAQKAWGTPFDSSRRSADNCFQQRRQNLKKQFYQITKCLNIPTCCHPNSKRRWRSRPWMCRFLWIPRIPEWKGGGDRPVMLALTWRTSEKRLHKFNPQHCFNKSLLKSSKILWQHQTRIHLV